MNEDDILLQNIDTTSNSIELYVPFETEYEVLHKSFHKNNNHNKVVKYLLRIPGLNYFMKWYLFKNIARNIEIQIGYLRAHHQIDSNLLKKLNDDDYSIIQINKNHMKAILSDLNEYKERYPHIYEVVNTVKTSRTILRIIHDQVLSLYQKGYLSSAEKEAMIILIFDRLRPLERFLSTFSYGTILDLQQ